MLDRVIRKSVAADGDAVVIRRMARPRYVPGRRDRRYLTSVTIYYILIEIGIFAKS